MLSITKVNLQSHTWHCCCSVCSCSMCSTVTFRPRHCCKAQLHPSPTPSRRSLSACRAPLHRAGALPIISRFLWFLAKNSAWLNSWWWPSIRASSIPSIWAKISAIIINHGAIGFKSGRRRCEQMLGGVHISKYPARDLFPSSSTIL